MRDMGAKNGVAHGPRSRLCASTRVAVTPLRRIGTDPLDIVEFVCILLKDAPYGVRPSVLVTG